MKFLIDENLNVKLIKLLRELGFDAVRVSLGSPDSEIAERARSEDRILLTLDKDFTDKLTFPPSRFNIIHIRIHPPYKEVVFEALKNLFATIPENGIKGLIILEKDFHLKFGE